jgi:germination protein M
LFVSCSKKENDKNRDDSEYEIYYIDKNTSELVEESYTPTGKAKEELVKEFLDAMRKEPKNIFYQKALPDTVIIKDFSFSEEDQLTLNFDSTYSELKGINEVLTRAAIVKTLSQIKELKYLIN